MATEGPGLGFDVLWPGFDEIPEDALQYAGPAEVGEEGLEVLADRSFPGGVAPTIAAAGASDAGHVMMLVAALVERRRWERAYDRLDE